MLEVRGVSRRFGGLEALVGVDLVAQAGQVVAVIGPNGSGKTTLLNVISGVLTPDAGTVRWEGRDITGWPPHRVAHLGIGRTFQRPRIMEMMTVRENIGLGFLFRARGLPVPQAMAMAQEVGEEVGLGDRLDVPAGDLTYIDQKRLELARALAGDPRLLLLDEWLAGLTEGELQVGLELLRRLRAQGKAVVLVEHVMSAVRAIADRVVVLHAGRKILEGEPEEVLSHPEVVATYLGQDTGC
jgi:ABC-type branched-subunit amino acid transport system ATPase component